MKQPPSLKSLQAELRTALSQRGERGALQFIAKHPEIARWSFCVTGGHSKYVLKEFPFGSRHRADIIVLTSYSGAWEIHMIELEPPDDRIINKDGTPSQRFNKAISQIHDWDDYIRSNGTAIRKDLSDWCMTKDLLRIHSGSGRPCNYSADYLHDPNTYAKWEYHIVIGDRAQMTEAVRRRMNQYSGSRCIGICTYGRFLDVAANFDKHRNGRFEHVVLTESEE